MMLFHPSLLLRATNHPHPHRAVVSAVGRTLMMVGRRGMVAAGVTTWSRRHFHVTLSSSSCLSSLQQQKRTMSSSSNDLKYTNVAITRDIPSSIVQDGLTKYSTNTEKLNLTQAREQHEYYVQTLQTLVPNVIQLPTIEEYPDCVFVEDTCFVVKQRRTASNNSNDDDDDDMIITVILTNPGHVSRRGEVDSMKDLFVNTILPNYRRDNNGNTTTTTTTTTIHLYDMREYNNENTTDTIYCDGGDVLYTGRHLFVGISERTNGAAVNYLQSIFHNNAAANRDMPPPPPPPLPTLTASPFQQQQQQLLHKPVAPVIPVSLPQNNTEALHLKSIVTHIDEYTLLVPTGQLGDDILQSMFEQHDADDEYDGYEIIRVPNLLACNVVIVSGTVLAQDGGCDQSKRILEDVAQRKNLNLIWTDNSELAKVDAALTCCSILL